MRRARIGPFNKSFPPPADNPFCAYEQAARADMESMSIDMTPLWIWLVPAGVITCIPVVAICYTLNRFIDALDRKWQRDSERDTISADADRLNRPFTVRESGRP